MKCHANKDYPNFPCSGVCSSAIITFTPLTRIQQSTFQYSCYTSDVKSVLTLFPSPFCNKGPSSALQKQFAFSPQKGIKTKHYLKEKKTCLLMCTGSQELAVPPELVKLNQVQLPATSRPCRKKSMATPSLAHPSCPSPLTHD